MFTEAEQNFRFASLYVRSYIHCLYFKYTERHLTVTVICPHSKRLIVFNRFFLEIPRRTRAAYNFAGGQRLPISSSSSISIPISLISYTEEGRLSPQAKRLWSTSYYLTVSRALYLVYRHSVTHFVSFCSFLLIT